MSEHGNAPKGFSPDDLEKFHKGMKKELGRREVRSASKRLKRNLKPKGPRQRDWTRVEFDDWEGADFQERERIMPLDERDRRRAVERAAFEAALRPYRELGCRILQTSARTGQGVDELRAALCGKATVLSGLSGTGKSSLIAAVQPGLELRTGEVSEWSGEGRHTTTQARMLRLDMGGYVVDTPGIREFGLAGLRRGELAGYFPEIAALAGGCRFKDCQHISEPGCAVRDAESTGAIAASRCHSYRQIYATLPK